MIQDKIDSNKKIAKDFDAFSLEYEETINKAISFGGNGHKFYIDVKRDRLVELASDIFPHLTEIKALDVGCGVGAYHPELKGVFGELHGAEISAKSVELAKQKNPWVDYRLYDGETTPFDDSSFDLVFAICVLHHVPVDSWNTFMSEIYRITKPGGLVVVFEHNPYNPATQYIVKNCEIDKDAVLLSSRILKTLFLKNGFTEIISHTFLTVLPKGRILRKIDRLLGHLPFGAQYFVSGRK